MTTINIKELTTRYAIHPGEYLEDELKSRKISHKDFALLLGIAPTLLNEVIKGKRNLSSELSILIGKCLDMDASIWNNLQANYELDKTKIQQKVQERFLTQLIGIILKIPTGKYFKQQNFITGNPMNDIEKSLN